MRSNGLSCCTACGLDAPYYDANGLCPLCSPDFDERHEPNDNESIPARAVESPTTIDTDKEPTPLQKRAQDAIAKYGGVRPAARALGNKLGEKVNHGVIGLAARGEDFPKARHVLGVPADPIPVYPCPDCGHVHKQLKDCSQKPTPAGMRRLALWVTDEQFEIIRAAWDSHPDGRVAWNLERIQENQ